MAAWIGLLALAAIALLAALLGGIDASWITAAAIFTAALGGADLALAASGPRQWPVLLPAVALGALALGWMAAL
jgi:hypothetical protein